VRYANIECRLTNFEGNAEGKNKKQKTRNKEQGISLLAAVSQTAQARNTERRKG
jgi:hypothetical protein